MTTTPKPDAGGHTAGPWLPTRADMPEYLRAAKRVNLVAHEPEGTWLWWTGHGKDESCQIEGTPSDWFWLAYTLIGLTDAKDCPYAEGDKPLPYSKEYIVACVNAMAGIADPATLRTQRDDLLAVAKSLRDIIHDDLTHAQQQHHAEAINFADLVIAKAGGGA